MNIVIKKRSPYGVVALTLGIISIVYSFFWYISIPTGILAVVYGSKGKNMVGSKVANTGRITGIVGISISGGLILLKTLFVAASLLSSF